MDSDVMVGLLAGIALIAVGCAAWFYLRPVGDAIRHASTRSLLDELERREIGRLGEAVGFIGADGRAAMGPPARFADEWDWPERTGRRRTGFDPTRAGIITISRNGVEAVNVIDNRA